LINRKKVNRKRVFAMPMKFRGSEEVLSKTMEMIKVIIYSLIISCFLSFSLAIAASSSQDISVDTTSECKTCEMTNGIMHCSPFKCPEIPASFEKYATSLQGKEVIVTLSEVKNSEDLPDTIHENEKVLKAISLFLQMPGIGDLSEEKMEWLFGYFRGKANWEDGISVWVMIKRIKDNLHLVGIGYAASTQPSSLYIFYDSSYKRIAKGEGGVISEIDFRLRGDELGVVFCRVPGSTHPAKDFAFLKKEKNEWFVQWNSVQESEWIAADGEVRYLGDDLSLIQVRGTDFGLGRVEEPVRFKILEDIDRQYIGRYFTGCWERKGNVYVRRSKLPRNAPLYERLREMADKREPIAIPFIPIGEENHDRSHGSKVTLK